SSRYLNCLGCLTSFIARLDMGVSRERQDSGARSALLFLPLLQGSGLDVLGADMHSPALLSRLFRPAPRWHTSRSGSSNGITAGGHDGGSAVCRCPAHASLARKVGDGQATIGSRWASVDEARKRLT
ncbi:hypothetical protein, partial [Sphingomonas sanguinis]|nr:hypothetical protein [Sphingomonas sanguinis]